jgi:beta-carotene 15,15'-dioxygenase
VAGAFLYNQFSYFIQSVAMRLVLIIAGVFVAFLPAYWIDVLVRYQFEIFAVGVLLLGVPHGAADVLVASASASNYRFLYGYVGRLVVFAMLLWVWPLVGFGIFILFAAYHFGETDLMQFKTNQTVGKWLVTSYGLVVLSVMLLSHWVEVQLLLASHLPTAVSSWIDTNRPLLLFLAIFMLLLASVCYILSTQDTYPFTQYSLYLFPLLSLLILIKLPLLLGFVFYFVVWHSLLSLQNIFDYLQRHSSWSNVFIFKQILIYSTLALVGIGIVGAWGWMFQSQHAFVLYLFVGLAVLTAPHVQVMHDMYAHLRSFGLNKKTTTLEVRSLSSNRIPTETV